MDVSLDNIYIMLLKRYNQLENSNFLLVLILGFTSIATQIIFLRELLSMFYGNELVIGIILANWMLITGLGALLGKYSEKIHSGKNLLFFLFTLYSIMPLVLTFLAYMLRNVIFTYGTMINIFQIFFSSFVLLLPFCLVSGFLFTWLSHLISKEKGKNYISKVYGLESAGSIVGGVLFNIVLVSVLETFSSLLFLVIINLLLLFYIAYQWKKKLAFVMMPILIIGTVVAFILIKPDLLSRQYLYKNQKIESFTSSPYGDIVVTSTGEQVNFFENNILLFSSNQPIANEESVHYPTLQHSEPDNVLLLSAGVPGIIEEMLKYDVKTVDYVEINPWLIRQLKDYSEIYSNKKVNVIKMDAREFVETTDKNYDVVIIGVPEPNTVQLNRFYTEEFYKELKKDLSPKGVISFSISGSSNYMSEETVKFYSSLYNTLKTSFQHVIIVPGSKNYFLASDDKLSYNFAELVSERGLNTQYVNRFYLQTDLLERRGLEMRNKLEADAAINKDFQPYTYSLKIRQWLSHFQFNFWIPLAFISLLGFYFLINLHPVNRGMFTAGFAGASLEIVLLVTFQIMFGSVFQMVGIIVTVFMAGLAFGTYYRGWFIKKVVLSKYYKLQFVLTLYTFLVPLMLLLFKSLRIDAMVIHGFIVILMFITSAIVGMIFSMASGLRIKSPAFIASQIYSVDLLGAALGSVIVSIYLIPLLGIIEVCFFIGGIIGIQALISSFQINRVKL